MTQNKAMSEGEQHQDRKIINWSEYNRALLNRGSLTFWFDEDIQSVRFHKKAGKTGRGMDKTFSDTALQTCLTLPSARRHPAATGRKGLTSKRPPCRIMLYCCAVQAVYKMGEHG